MPQPLYVIGQQPLQLRLPQQIGVKALYWRMQTVVQHLLQHPPQPKQGHQAEAGAVAQASAARLKKPRAKSFFMGVRLFLSSGQLCTNTILVPGARPKFHDKHTRQNAGAPHRCPVFPAGTDTPRRNGEHNPHRP
jgi:hypothetical protein